MYLFAAEIIICFTYRPASEILLLFCNFQVRPSSVVLMFVIQGIEMLILNVFFSNINHN